MHSANFPGISQWVDFSSSGFPQGKALRTLKNDLRLQVIFIVLFTLNIQDHDAA